MVTIHVSAFQPFKSRVDVDTVLALRFQYDAVLIEVLKDALQAARDYLCRRNLGNWLPEYRCWFVERDAWPIVCRRLMLAGVTLSGPELDETQRQGPSPSGCSVVDLKSTIKRWHHEMVLRYHPDRGGGERALQAINHAHDRLLDMVEGRDEHAGTRAGSGPMRGIGCIVG